MCMMAPLYPSASAPASERVDFSPRAAYRHRPAGPGEALYNNGRAVKTLPILLAILGLTLATVLVGYFGFDSVAETVTSIGWGGFAILVAWQAGLFFVLGAAWDVLVPRAQARRPWWTFTWARAVRDSAANCLPFSQMGGFVFGARTLTMHGVGWPVATASTVVDVTAELLAQIGFAAIGLVILMIEMPNSALTLPLAVTLVAAVAASAGFIWTQRGAAPLVRRLGAAIAGDWFTGTGERIDAFQAALDALYRHGGSIALAVCIHLVGWLATGVAGWLAYRLLGAEISLPSVLALEALLNVALAMAFLVPGAAGVQEAAYAALGTFFGVPAELSLGVSILRRAKDLALGLPVLLIYQFVEVRRLRFSKQPSAQ